MRLVLPAYNEERTLTKCIDTWKKILPITVIDSGSTDTTRGIAYNNYVHTISLKAGKGRAVYWALKNLDADKLIFADTDIHTPEDIHLERFLDKPYINSDFVLGMFDCESFLRATNLVTRPLLDAFDSKLGELVRPITGFWMIDKKLALKLLHRGYTNDWGIVLQLVLRYYKLYNRLPLQCFIGKVKHNPKSSPELIPMARQLTKIIVEELNGWNLE